MGSTRDRLHPRLPALVLWLPLVAVLAACGNTGESENDEAIERRLERIAGLGYVGSAPDSDASHAIVHYEPERVHPGLNLYNAADANAAILMDMEGNILHRWSSDFASTFPDYTGSAHGFQKAAWQRVTLLPDGELLAIQEGIGLIRLDLDSRILWAIENGAHHDLDVDAEGRIYALTRSYGTSKAFPEKETLMMEGIELLTPSGELVDRIDLEQAWLDSEFDLTLPEDHPGWDLFHTNTISILDGRLEDRDPAFRAGNLLLSIRNTHELVVIDMNARKLVWRQRGPWRRQHEPSILPNGRMLLFDNLGARPEKKVARVLEFDPFTLEIFMEYTGEPDNRLRSTTGGVVHRLDNENLLITDTNQARAYEITRDGRLVWQFNSPHRHPKKTKRRVFLRQVARIDPASVRDWLDVGETME